MEKSKVLENSCGQIKKNIKDSGKMLKWTEGEYLLGLMEEGTKECLKKIIEMVLVYFSGPTTVCIKVSGKKIRKMVLGR